MSIDPQTQTRTLDLENVSVASPCTESWDAMTGDERVRACGRCELNVYDLSGLSRPEAETLIRSTEGRLCVRLHRRADGTVLTRDCPRGLAAARRRMRWAAAALAAFLSAGGGVLASANDDVGTLWDAQPLRTVARWFPGLRPIPSPPVQIEMGIMCPVEPQPAPVGE